MPRITTLTGKQLSGLAGAQDVPYDIDLDSLTLRTQLDISQDLNNDSKVLFGQGGRSMYTASSSSDNIRRYTLSTGYDVSTYTVNGSFGVVFGTDQGIRDAVWFGDNGNYVYTLEAIPFSAGSGAFGNVPSRDFIRRGDLSSPYNLGTINWGARSATEISGEDNVRNMQFNADGTQLYIMVGTEIRSWTMSTAWNTQSLQLGTADETYDFITDYPGTEINDFHWVAQGNKGYLLYDGTKLAEYTASTPYDISTLSSTGETRTLSFSGAAPTAASTTYGGLYIAPERGKFWVSGTFNDIGAGTSTELVWEFETNKVLYT
jgi:hypothetical protein